MYNENIEGLNVGRATSRVLCLVLAIFVGSVSFAEGRSGLVLTDAGVATIRANLGTVPLFDQSVTDAQAEVDAEIALGIDTPLPEDYSGGYTHERHKRNFFIAQQAGVLYQILAEEKYAVYVRDMLFQYEAMYQDLPLHPKTRSYARGKLFWQCLNDANWLVYMSQAYDAIYDWLTPAERAQLEDNLFRPFADHISIDSPQFFNRVHNHSTWGVAAVGMIGLVMKDDELVARALYGITDDGLALNEKDNDGGFIKVEGQKAGFFANIDQPFSPDGYYTEGPYYQRYAMYPFLMFAQSLNNVRPEQKIFEYGDGVLLKAIYALLNLSDADGEFFPLNDAQKGMSYFSRELVTAVNIAYHAGTRNSQLVDIADKQGQVLLDDSGFAIALASRQKLGTPFVKSSINLRDGADGSEGGVAILRQGQEDLTAVFKYSAHGLSHGHYDKLSYSLYEKGDEVLQDYGLVRFVNIEQKGGGNYLKENNTWAKQTIAHNTLTRDETSHFKGKYEIGSRHHSELVYFDDSNPSIHIASALERNAYFGTAMRRTIAMVADGNQNKPFLIDVFRVDSSGEHQYDLPFHFLGQVIATNFEHKESKRRRALGRKNGYQHLFVESRGRSTEPNAKFTWMSNNKFYTLTTVSGQQDELIFARLGANDPDFNLRRDATLIVRRDNSRDTTFASVVEPHGSYSPVTERATDLHSNIDSLTVLRDDASYTALKITFVTGGLRYFILSNDKLSTEALHELDFEGHQLAWRGAYYYGSPE